MNMRRNDIDWKAFATQLLWGNVVHCPDACCGYSIMTEDGPEGRGIKKGDIGYWSISSYLSPGTYKDLTWKELASELGLFEE